MKFLLSRHSKVSGTIFAVLICTVLLQGCGWATAARSNQQCGKLVLSANDQRLILTDGSGQVRSNPGAGSVSVLDFSSFPPNVKHIEPVSCTVVGPPVCVAITPDESLALVTAAMKLDPADPQKQVPDNFLTVIDLQAKSPKVLTRVTVGNKPSGISITPDGKMAMAADRADGTVSVLSIKGKDVKLIDTVKVCEPNDGVSHVAISPDGKTALAGVAGKNRLSVLKIENGKVIKTEQGIDTGPYPYAIDFAPDGSLAIAAHVEGSSIIVIDTSSEAFKVIDDIYVGRAPEGMDISPDGKWVAVSCLNNSLSKPDDPERQEFGLLVLLARDGKALRIVDKINVDRIPQAVVFTPDSKYMVVSSYEHEHLRIYTIENEKIKDTGVLIKTPGQPAALRIAGR